MEEITKKQLNSCQGYQNKNIVSDVIKSAVYGSLVGAALYFLNLLTGKDPSHIGQYISRDIRNFFDMPFSSPELKLMPFTGASFGALMKYSLHSIKKEISEKITPKLGEPEIDYKSEFYIPWDKEDEPYFESELEDSNTEYLYRISKKDFTEREEPYITENRIKILEKII